MDSENRLTVRFSDKDAERIERLVSEGEFKNEAAAVKYYFRTGLQREAIDA